MDDLGAALAGLDSEVISFAQELVRIKSYTGQEEEIIKFIEKRMLALGYDHVVVDGMGNCIGVIGNGDTKILFDSHADTVRVDDRRDWTVDPFGGEIRDGKLYGRGSVDMKSALAASVYAGSAIKRLGLDAGKTIYVCASIMEEDYDGENLSYIFRTGAIRPDYVVICEATTCRVCLGQKGRALFKVDLEGVSAHGSAPERGVNPIYKMGEIIRRVEALNSELAQGEGEHGTIALTKIECDAASLNAIPSRVSLYIDRRLVAGEDRAVIEREMNTLIAGADAAWSVYQVVGTSWTGLDVCLDSFLPAWEISLDHPLTRAAFAACTKVLGQTTDTTKWDFSTNGVASAKLGIPTIGYGPGDSKLAHMKDEYCPVDDITKALWYYVEMIRAIQD
ncbi:MAG: YgeY family selenium metabolism-linked hydrolase [Bacillota bacterium]